MNRNNALYQDLRGSMSQFRPLTPDDVECVSDGMLDYDWIEELLSGYGLSINKVVFDPDRPIINAFYADYEKALYCEIYLLMRNFAEGHRPLFGELGRKRQHGNDRLQQRQWQSFYTIDVPLPMQAYDFQRRMHDIEPESVFDTWFHIYKRLDYSNGIWKPETIDYVFANAPACEKPPVEENGLITIYRGVGEQSQHHREAISWSTNPGNALWFANHSGFGTQLLVAEVDPKDVVAYFPGYSSENEVLVKPGSVQNVRSKGMLPANQDTFTRLALPMLMEFRAVGQQALRFGYSTGDTDAFSVHGIHHILRVLYLSLLYVYHSGEYLDDMDKQILIYFSILHDVARVNEHVDGQHGFAAVEAIHQRGLRIKGMKLSKKDYRIAEQIICYHCRDDDEGIAAIQVTEGLSRKDKDRAVRLFLIAKDMDGLDRVRFNGLDYRMLRTPFAARLPLIAGCLLKENVLEYIQGKE